MGYPDAILGLNRSGRTPYEEAIFTAGECGRIYQEDLIRVLRKNPRHWTSRSHSPELEILNKDGGSGTNRSGTKKNQLSLQELQFTLGNEYEYPDASTNYVDS